MEKQVSPQRKKHQVLRFISILFIAYFLTLGTSMVSTAGITPPTEVMSQNLNPTYDTTIDQVAPDTVYNNSTTLYVSNTFGNNSSGWERDGLLYFDLSEFPTVTQVQSATLYLYYYDYDDTNSVHRALSLHQLTREWNINNVTWRNRPSHITKNFSFAYIPQVFGWLTWDVTTEIQRIVNNPTGNFGWQLSDDTPWLHANVPLMKFKSSKTQTNYQPYLNLTYTIPLTVWTTGPYEGYINENLSMNSTIVGGGNPPYHWYWDFGDGSTASSQNTTHLYIAAGSYTITLTVYDATGKTATTTTSAIIKEITNEPSISIQQPQNGLYLMNKKIVSLHRSWVIGSLTVYVDTSSRYPITKVKFLLDNQIQTIDTTAPYFWTWSQQTSRGRHVIKVIAVDSQDASAVDQITVWKLF
jgi:PKD repeat protein